MVSTTTNDVSAFTDNLGTYDCANTAWTEHTLDLSAYDGETIYIAFYQTYSAATWYGFGIDDVLVEEIPATPIFTVSPETYDFGTVNVGTTSTAQTFTISNTGGGTLGITDVFLTGDDTGQFILTDGNTYTHDLDAGESITVDIAFSPDSEGTKTANLTITDDQSKATHDVVLDGEGYVPPQGSTCDNPISITLPIEEETGNTGDYGDNYSSSDISPSSNYLNGDDVVYEFTTTGGNLTGTITTTGSWIGAFVLSDCPGSDPLPTPVIQKTSSGNTLNFSDALSSGTYFLIISTYPTPQSIDYTINLDVESFSSENDIIAYSFAEQTGPAAINSTEYTVEVEVDYTADIADLVATFELSEGATAYINDGSKGANLKSKNSRALVEQFSGVTSNDFTNPVTYIIEAEDATQQNWTVTVTQEDPPAILAPTNLSTTDIGITTATLNWDAVTGASHYEVRYGLSGFNVESGTYTELVEISNTFQDIGTLTIDTAYDWYVRATDGTGKATSAWSSVASFTTLDGIAVNPDPADGAVNVEVSSTTLDWDDVNGASKYLITIGTTSGGTEIENEYDCGTTSAYTYGSDWTDGTTYYWTVTTQYNDGLGKKSRGFQTVAGTEWTFTTEFGAITSFPFVETFEDDSTTRPAWTQIQEAGTADWTYDTGSSGGSVSTAYEGTYNARFVGQSGTNSPITKLVTPPLDISALSAPTVSFYYAQQDWAGDQNELKVYYRTSDSNPWVEISHYTENVDAWTYEILPLPNPSATYQIAFEGINNYGYANVIDLVTVENQSYVGANLYISEVCDGPTPEQTDEGFIEIYNPNNYSIDLGGLVVERGTNDTGTNFVPDVLVSYTIPNGTTIVAHGFLVVGNSADVNMFNTSWGTSLPTATAGYVPGIADLDITNGHAYGLNDEVTKAIIEYTPAVGINERATQPTEGNWVELGNPADAAPGEFGNEEGPLPVTFDYSSFQATFVNEDLTIFWATQSEENNSYWNIYRAEEDSFEAATKINGSEIEGEGTTDNLTKYSYVDNSEINYDTTYYYWLESVDYAGHTDRFGSTSVVVDMPEEEEVPEPIILGLHQNYPNPFNPDTTIKFAVEEDGEAQLTIYNAKGQKIATVFKGEVQAEQYEIVEWNGKDRNGKEVASGVYMYKLETANKTYMKKMLLIK